MKHKFIETPMLYDGSQLRSHFAYETFGLEGDSIIAFIGNADVKGDQLVDLEDKRQGHYIYSNKMLHIIIEHFQGDLDRIILLQRILICIACEELNFMSVNRTVKRTGDDLFFNGRKMSVSIATCSPVSCLIHTGFNIETGDTPVPSSGLQELDIDPGVFADKIMKRYMEEFQQISKARWKVRSVP